MKFTKFIVSADPDMLQAVDELAAKEFRNRSDLVREALRRYLKAAEQGETLNRGGRVLELVIDHKKSKKK